MLITFKLYKIDFNARIIYIFLLDFPFVLYSPTWDITPIKV
jgi:hypothetical protein